MTKKLNPEDYQGWVTEYERRYNVTGLSLALVEGCKECTDKVHLRRYLKSQALNAQKRNSRYKPLTQEVSDQMTTNEQPSHVLIFMEVMAHLPEVLRDVALYRYQGYKVHEIAILMKTNESMIKGRLTRLREMFQVDATLLGICRKKDTDKSLEQS